MKSKSTKPQSVDEYIAGYPPEVQARLQKIRQSIRKAAPKAEECISYQIPGYKQDGPVAYFAAFKKHIGFYPAPRGSEEFKKELAAYAGGKGTVQFPHDEPLPFGLVTRMVKFRAKQNLEKARAKEKKKA